MGTTKQGEQTRQDILEAIAFLHHDTGANPSIREIAGHVHMAPTAVHWQLGHLKARGLVNFQPHKERTLVITPQGRALLASR